MKYTSQKQCYSRNGKVRARVLAKGDQTKLLKDRKIFGWYTSFGDHTVAIFTGISVRSILMKAHASGLKDIFSVYRVQFN